MDPKFDDAVRRELESLLQDLSRGVDPRNPSLRDAVYRKLRAQASDYVSLHMRRPAA